MFTTGTSWDLVDFLLHKVLPSPISLLGFGFRDQIFRLWIQQQFIRFLFHGWNYSFRLFLPWMNFVSPLWSFLGISCWIYLWVFRVGH